MTPRRLDLYRRFVDEWPEVLRHPVLLWPEHGPERMRVEEFAEGGTFIVRVDLPGIDPEKDVEISLVGYMLHIDAERREEEKAEERHYVRREIHYGSFHRELPVPMGTLEADIQASYKDGMLEVHAPDDKGRSRGGEEDPRHKEELGRPRPIRYVWVGATASVAQRSGPLVAMSRRGWSYGGGWMLERSAERTASVCTLVVSSGRQVAAMSSAASGRSCTTARTASTTS